MVFDLRQGIIETANALGISPLDLATVISYESGFNPNVWGGAGGRHYGLIQFGPGERQQYGVRVGDPSSQLGANGAIVRYLTGRGFRRGGSLLDLYSTINAGSPGLYGASDEASGGQPGDVYAKVTQQFGPHRQRAQAFLGGKTGTLRHVGGAGSGPENFTTDYDPLASQGGEPMMIPPLAREEDLGSAMADTMASAVGGGGGGGTTSGDLYGSTQTEIPPLDFASAQPQAAPTPDFELSPLAQLFKIKNIGQGPVLQAQADPTKLYGQGFGYG